jgi:hypothetical protein
MQRTQKLEAMRLQIAFLEEELVEVQRQFNIVKELGL